MKNKLKFIGIITFVAVMGFCLASCEDSISFDNPGKDFQYTGSSTITIIGYTGPGGNVTIPASINGKPVTAIGNGAFSGNHLTSVSIPSSVTYIGDDAFISNALTSVSIPNSVTYIGSQAFDANGLTSITLSSSITRIEWGTFRFNRLTSVSIPSSVTYIDDDAFDVNQLTSVSIPSSVKYIGDGAFGRNQLTSITIGANVTIYPASFGDNDGQGGGISNGFYSAYNSGGKAAGTYTRPNTSNTTWTKQ